MDDVIFTGNDESMFVEFKRSMMLEFDMTDLGNKYQEYIWSGEITFNPKKKKINYSW